MLCSECRAHGNSVNFDSAGRQKEHFYGMKLESYVFPECIFPLGYTPIAIQEGFAPLEAQQVAFVLVK